MKIGFSTWGMPDLPIDTALGRPDYDPLAAAELTYRTLENAFQKAGTTRGG